MKKTLIFLFVIALGLVIFTGNVLASETEWEDLDSTEEELETGIGGTLIMSPVASPVAGTYTSTQSVTLTASGIDSIRYTTNGSTPTCSSAQYTGAISVSSSMTIKAISCYPNNNESSVASFVYTISTPASTPPRTSGGSGGGVPTTPVSTSTPDTPALTPEDSLIGKSTAEMSFDEKLRLIAELQAMIVFLQSEIAKRASTPLVAEGEAPSVCHNITFTRNLSLGDSGEDVRCLQAFLNQNPDTRVSLTGAGSSGNETQLFGALTRIAVIKFQEKYASEVLTPLGLSSGTGFFGISTRSKINKLLGR